MPQPYVEKEYWRDRFEREGDAYCFPAGATAGERAEHTLAIVKALEPHLGRYHCILDFGCGIGRLAPLLIGKGESARGSYIGVDMCLGAINRAEELHPDGYFVYGDAKDFHDDKFDCIVAVTVFQHLRDETFEAAAKELRRVAAPGCEVFIIDAASSGIPGDNPPHMHRRICPVICDSLGLVDTDVEIINLHGVSHCFYRGRTS